MDESEDGETQETPNSETDGTASNGSEPEPVGQSGDGLDEYGVDADGFRRKPGRHAEQCTCNTCKARRASSASGAASSVASELAEQADESRGVKTRRKRNDSAPVGGRSAMKYDGKVKHDTVMFLPLTVAAAKWQSTRSKRSPKSMAQCHMLATAGARVTAKHDIKYTEEVSLGIALLLFFAVPGDKCTEEEAARANSELQADMVAFMNDAMLPK